MNNASATLPLLTLAQAKGMVALLDNNGNITAASTPLLQFLLTQNETLAGIPFSQLAITSEKEKAQNFCTEVLDGSPVFGYLALRHTGIGKKVVNISMVPVLQDGSINGAYCFF